MRQWKWQGGVEEMMRDLRDYKGVDVIWICHWPLTLRYTHAYPRDKSRIGKKGSRNRGEIL